jgi:hypothetical protein
MKRVSDPVGFGRAAPFHWKSRRKAALFIPKAGWRDRANEEAFGVAPWPIETFVTI